MPLDKQSALRLAAAIAGLDDHEARIRRDPEYAYWITKNPALLREFHAQHGIANRLEELVDSAESAATFDVRDIADGALKAPFRMSTSDGQRLLRYMRERVARTPIVKLEVTADRDLILHAMVYDELARRSVLKIVDSSVSEELRRTGSCHAC